MGIAREEDRQQKIFLKWLKISSNECLKPKTQRVNWDKNMSSKENYWPISLQNIDAKILKKY